jgi:hypothetical protein
MARTDRAIVSRHLSRGLKFSLQLNGMNRHAREAGLYQGWKR